MKIVGGYSANCILFNIFIILLVCGFTAAADEYFINGTLDVKPNSVHNQNGTSVKVNWNLTTNYQVTKYDAIISQGFNGKNEVPQLEGLAPKKRKTVFID